MGIGKTAFGAFPDRTLRSLAVEAGEKCMQDAGVSPSQIEAFYLGNFAGPSFVGQNHLAPYIAGSLGLTGVPCTRFEAACASGGSAFFHAVSSVAAGLNDIVLVAGVEKMTSQTTPKVTEILAGAGDMAGEGRAGATFPALFAMIARRHMYQYGTTREQLAAVAVKNHANGAKNPLAHMRKVITMEQALAGKMISEPLTVFDCSLISDGAAAVVIVPLERASEFTDQPVRILGIAQTSDYVALGCEGRHHHVLGGARGGGESLQNGARERPRHRVRRSARLFHHRRDRRDRRPGIHQERRGRTVRARRPHPLARRASGERQRRAEGQGPSGGRDRRRPDLRCGAADPRARRASFNWIGIRWGWRRTWAARARRPW